MDVPILSSFVEGLKLFLQNKRLRWLFLVFMLGVLYITVVGSIAVVLLELTIIPPPVLVTFFSVTGGIWPIFFMLGALLSLLGLQRFVASEESYTKSFGLLIIWAIVSGVVLFLMAWLAFLLLLILLFGVAFIGWISFQAYFSVRSSLRYADMLDRHVSRVEKALSVMSHILAYAIVVGALMFAIIMNVSSPDPELFRIAVAILGTGMALLFNFVNGVIMARHRNKPTLANVALVGFFVALYSAYFIYSAGTASAAGLDIVASSISIFFVLYTMSNVGRTLSSRSHLETRLKMSAESAASVTFFLASGFYFADMLLPLVTVVDPDIGASISDAIKLLLFPFVALVMEFLYLRRVGKAISTPPDAEAVPAGEEAQEPARVEEPTSASEKPAEEEGEPEPAPANESDEHISDDV